MTPPPLAPTGRRTCNHLADDGGPLYICNAEKGHPEPIHAAYASPPGYPNHVELVHTWPA